MTWCNTHFGRKYEPLNFDPTMVNVEDMAYALASKYRYNCHTRISVAQHSVAVLAVVERNFANLSLHDARFVYFHDGCEAYLPDVPAPIRDEPPLKPLKDLETHVQGCVYVALGVDVSKVPEEVFQALARADKLVCEYEKKHFKSTHPDWKSTLLPTDKERGALINAYSNAWTPEKAERRFLEVAARVRGAVGP